MFWESVVEENNEIIMDASYHMNCNSPSAGLCKLGALNISNATSSTLQDISTDNMSFYDEEESRTLALQQSEHDHIWNSEPSLLPEGPAQRFRIVEKSKGFQRLQNATNSHYKTPPRGGSGSGGGGGGGGGGGSNFRVFNSLSSSCSMESSIDDEYLELFEMESLEEQLQLENNKPSLGLPSNLNSLISGQIKSSLTETPEMRRPSVRRCLSLTENHSEQKHLLPKTPEQLPKNANEELCTTPFSSKLSAMERCNSSSTMSPFSSFCFKRPDPPSVTNSPNHPKRYRGDEKENYDYNLTSSSVPSMSKKNTNTTTSSSSSSRVPYRKSMSMNDAEIMTALSRSDVLGEPDLIGDFSKPFVLPLIEGQHRDLKTISSDTVARLINGDFENQVANYVIVDCRYPYEYEGGHIRGAKNLYTQEQITEEFLTQQKTEQHQACTDAAGNKRNIIIFHCEFSSKRGPRLSRFLRNIDRARNTNSYPTLDYPEIYLLHNGYKEFYETHSELCDPTAYRPMLEPGFSDAYRHFRAKSKSWNGDGDGLGGTTTRLKKSRSRLML